MPLEHCDNNLECEAVSKVYRDGNREVNVLSGVDLKLAAGERVAILGNSGAGKSTLLNILGGLDSPTQGTVRIGGQVLTDLNEHALSGLRNRHLGFVYQFHHLLPEFSAQENTAMPLLIRGESREDGLDQAKEWLSRVGLADRLEHRPGELSGGERQRVAVARAMIANPRCVLMDEPSGNLDSGAAAQVLELIDKMSSENEASFLVVTHDLAVAERMDRRLELRAGRLWLL